MTAEDVVERAFAELGAAGAFLPEGVPPRDLPPPFAGYTRAAGELVEHFPADRGGVRSWLDASFGDGAPAIEEGVGGLDELARHKLLSTLTALAHAYRWDTVPPAPERFASGRSPCRPGSPVHSSASLPPSSIRVSERRGRCTCATGG